MTGEVNYNDTLMDDPTMINKRGRVVGYLHSRCPEPAATLASEPLSPPPGLRWSYCRDLHGAAPRFRAARRESTSGDLTPVTNSEELDLGCIEAYFCNGTCIRSLQHFSRSK